jgi:hypothetical protein
MTLDHSFWLQPGLSVKISPETFIKFDGSDRITIQNIRSEQSIRIQPDILLVFWNILDWTPMSEVLAPWPPADQEKIMDHFQRMHEAKVLLNSLDKPAETNNSENLLPDLLCKNLHFNLENHVVIPTSH